MGARRLAYSALFTLWCLCYQGMPTPSAALGETRTLRFSRRKKAGWRVPPREPVDVPQEPQEPQVPVKPRASTIGVLYLLDCDGEGSYGFMSGHTRSKVGFDSIKHPVLVIKDLPPELRDPKRWVSAHSWQNRLDRLALGVTLGR
jgi:hypothetical protein